MIIYASHLHRKFTSFSNEQIMHLSRHYVPGDKLSAVCTGVKRKLKSV